MHVLMGNVYLPGNMLARRLLRFGGYQRLCTVCDLLWQFHVKVITNMFCVRTFSAEMRLNMVSAWYHGENDATLSIRNIGSHSLVTGEQVLSVRSLRAEKLQDCAELTFEDLRGNLNGAVIVLFGKMEPYHENLDFELRIASGSARRRNEGTEVTLLQTRDVIFLPVFRHAPYL